MEFNVGDYVMDIYKDPKAITIFKVVNKYRYNNVIKYDVIVYYDEEWYGKSYSIGKKFTNIRFRRPDNNPRQKKITKEQFYTYVL